MNKVKLNISKYTSILLIIFLLAGCSSVRFASPQPEKGRALKKIPKSFRGTYADSIFTLKLSADTLFFEKQAFPITRDDPVDKQVQLRFYNPNYFAVFKDSLWYDIFMVNFYENKMAIYTLNSEQRTLNLLKRIVKVDTIDGETDQYMIDPSHREFDEILEWDLWKPAAVLTKKKNNNE